VVVDATIDLPPGIAECTRLRELGAPVALVSREEPAQRVLDRAGITAVLPSSASSSEFVELVSSLLGAPQRDSGVVLVAELIALNEHVHVDRARRLLLLDGREVSLSAQKFDVLCHFVARAGIAVGASELVKAGLLRPSQAQRFKGLVQELRVRLGPARDLISAVPGYGYRFEFGSDRRVDPRGL
jgi:DNA-binding response OmpR family regulator